MKKELLERIESFLTKANHMVDLHIADLEEESIALLYEVRRLETAHDWEAVKLTSRETEITIAALTIDSQRHQKFYQPPGMPGERRDIKRKLRVFQKEHVGLPDDQVVWYS